MSEFWKTAIAQVRENEILVRGYPIEQLIARRSFGDVAYLLFTGELPQRHEGRMVEAVLIACCDHSLAAPSVDAVRFVASAGVPLQAAVAAGVTAIGDTHAGAIEPCARLLQEAVREGFSPKVIFERLKRDGQRLPGFGHPVHSHDPRTQMLFSLAVELEIAGPHVELALKLEATSEAMTGQRLPINVDGAIGAIMSELKIDPALGKAFFITGRSLGFAAHAFEQMTKERPFKVVAPEEILYTGPARRDVPKP